MTAQHLYRIDEIQSGFHHHVGNKAFYLGLLAQAGYPVVPGIVVSSSMFRAFWQRIQWNVPLFEDFPHSSLHIDVDNYQQLRAIAQQLQHAIHTTPLSDDWLRAIESATQSLDGENLIFRPSLALNGALNPTLDNQIQGLLPTQISRSAPDAIAHTLKKTWAGLVRAKSLFYWQRLGVPLQQILLSVLVQSLYPTQSSGRLRSATHHQIEIETIWGMGNALVTGEAIPVRYWVDAVSGSIQQHESGRQSWVYRVSKNTAMPISQSVGHSSESRVVSPLPHLQLDWQTSDREGLDRAVLDSVLFADPDLAGSALLETEKHGDASDGQGATSKATLATLAPPISAATLKQLAHLSRQVNRHLNLDAELEWIVCQPTGSSPYSQGLEDKEDMAVNPVSIYLTQVLPEGIHHGALNSAPESDIEKDGTQPQVSETVDIHGMAAAPGQVTARAWVLTSESTEYNSAAIASLPPDYVLIAVDVTPDWMHLIQQSKGIVSERGGMTCHAAIIARELGIPAVVGVPKIAQRIRTGDLILLDGDRGTIRRLSGASSIQAIDCPTDESFNPLSDLSSDIRPNRQPDVQSSIEPSDLSQSDRDLKTRLAEVEKFASQGAGSQQQTSGLPQPQRWQQILTQITAGDRPNATQLTVSISQAEMLPRLATLPFDGIGLLRAELAILPLLDQKPPQWWIDQGYTDTLCQRIATHIELFAEAVYPRPVYYRTLDVRSHDFASLFSTEPHPNAYDLLGIHGTWSYQLDPAMFQIELAALRRIQVAGMDNIRLLLPFVRTVEEFNHCRRYVVEADLYDSPNFQLWIMAEVPSVLFLLEDYVKAGVDGIAIGTNDLTQLVLGIDRDHPHMQPIFNQNHPAIQRALRHLIQTARELGIPCSICGQAPVQHPELIASIVQWGGTTICVPPAAIPQTYRAIAKAERVILLDAIRRGDLSSGTDSIES
ncbi:MAG: putative PEP-binding protein [Elainellaceae cyanobacterium]